MNNCWTICLIIILSFLAQPFVALTKNCHYSCTYCGDPYYSHCIFCEDGYTIKPIKNAQNIKQYYNTVEQYPWGLCIDLLPDFNLLGIVLFFTVTILFVWLKNRTIFYFINTMQTFALFSLIEVGYVGSISYLLQSFEYFMFITSMNRANKLQVMEIFQASRYRMYEFLHSYSFKANFIPVFIFSVLALIFALLMPVCRYFSKKQGSLWTLCSCINIQKIFTFLEILCIFSFFFLIQQSILLISIGVFLDHNFRQADNIVMIIFYAIFLAFMIVNICSKNFDFFPNKAGENIQLLKKCVIAPFIVLPVNANIAVVPFMLFMALLGLLFNSVGKNQKKITQFHQGLVKRQFRYRIVQILAICMVGVYFLVERYVKTSTASNAVGIVTILVIAVYVLCFFVQIGIELYGKFWLKQDQKLYKLAFEGGSSMRQSKNLQQTLQNFEATQEGIMDMVFFSRNLSLDKQSPSKMNIKLNIDVLDEEQDITQNKQKITTNTSPKNRDNQRHKSRTARTPKNDRSSRFRLNKVFEPEQKQIENIDMKSINMQQEQVTNIEKSDRSQYAIPKTSRREEAIKTTREIKIQIRDGEEERSPRFGLNIQIENVQKMKVKKQASDQEKQQNEVEQAESQIKQSQSEQFKQLEQDKAKKGKQVLKKSPKKKKTSKVSQIYGRK